MPLSALEKQLIAGAVAEVDPAQIDIWQQMPVARKAQLGLSMIHVAERVGVYRVRTRQPELTNRQSILHVRRAKKEEKDAENMTAMTSSFEDFMRQVIDALVEAEIEYLIGGAVGLWAWGELRTTADFDLVINMPIERIVALSDALKRHNFLVPPDILLDNLLAPGDLPVNAHHLDTGFKAELFLLRQGDALRSSALFRRLLVDYGPPLGEVYVHSPEDLILYKLHYFSLSQQPKHIRDIASIVQTLGDELDTAYIGQWVARLGLDELWQEVWEKMTR